MQQPKRINIGWHWERDYSRESHDYLKSIGATTVETYVKWIDIEPEPGQVNFKRFDRELDHFARYGVKWQPFLICGPWYATPYWFRESKDSHFFRCLEHDQNSGIQSIWNRKFETPTRHFLKLFHDHYRTRMDQIDSLLLGISGDYGEAIFPCIGNFDGQYHTHRGFWCNDTAAIEDFRRHCQKQWKTIKALNACWGTDYRDFGQVRPFLKKHAPSRRAMVDQVYWYRGAMLNHAEFWMRQARKLWPTKDMYLCMGGDGSAEEGQHYAAAASLCAKYNVGIRDTNARDNIRFLNTYQCSTAVGTNFNGTYCGFESSHGSTPEFIVARMFAFIISNAREFHEYSFLGKAKVIRNFRRFRKWMDLRFQRKADAAIFSSQAYVNWVHEHATAWDIKEFPWGLPKPPHDLFDTLRYHFDFDLVNDTLVRAEILKNYKVLVVPAFTIIEADILKLLRGYVAAGGQVIVYGGQTPQTVEGQPADMNGATAISTLPALLRQLQATGIRVKLKKDGIFEAMGRDGKILCYDEKRSRIYWKR
ncbi:MAG: family 14 glycosylhydrolase [Phycisphaerae bacterium]|nr:family 14 glycosylhydrolase [Phycisphaerae bacterium]